MAALALTSGGTLSLAESTSGWTGNSFSLEPDIKVQGSNSVSCAQTSNGNNDVAYTGSFNLTGTHIRLFVNLGFVGNFSSTNPVQVYLTGGQTQYVTYYASNSDYGGGWVDLIVDTALFTSVNLSSVTAVGVRVVTSSKPRNVPANSWFDNWRYSNGVEIYSSTTESVSFAQAAAQDATNSYGVLKAVDGVIFAVGEIVLGRTNASNANIVSANETIVFPSRFVSSSLYKIQTQQGTGNTDIDISGLVCKTVGGTDAELIFNSNLNSLSITGSAFIDMGAITMTPTVTSPTFSGNSLVSCGATAQGISATNCTWSASGAVTLSSGVTLTSCQITNSPASSAVIASSLDQFDACTFTSSGTGHAVDLGTVSTNTSMTWNSTAVGYAGTNGSTGNETLLVNVASGVTLTINDEGSGLTYRNTGAGTVNVVSGAVTVRVVAQNQAGTAIEGARVLLKRVSNGTTILSGLTDASGVVQDTAYTYAGDEAVTGWVRKSSASPYYKQGALSGTITATGFNQTAIMIADE